MPKYKDKDIEIELNRCKEIIGIPTTIRQLSLISKYDKDVFIRYLKSHEDKDILIGEDASNFNKKKAVERMQKTRLLHYGDKKFNNREKFKNTLYKDSLKNEIISKIKELDHPVTSKYLAYLLNCSYYKIESHINHFNIQGVLEGKEAIKFNREWGIEKRKQYFKDHPDEAKERTKKAQSTKLIKYGDKNYCNLEKRIETNLSYLNPEFASVYYDRDKSIEFLKNHSFKSRDQIKDYFKVSFPSIENWIYRNKLEDIAPHLSSNSNVELQLRSQLENLGFTIHNSRSLIKPWEIDMYNPGKKIAVEFNGMYWHSNLVLKDKKYHFNKSKLCEEKGIRLIHIYEWEWNDERIKNIILSIIKIACNVIPNRIYARQCEIKEITNKEAKAFNIKNHLQGHRNAQITYGLFYKNQLVQLMSFSKTRYNKNLKNKDDWEIIRGCPGSNNIVIGGVSKLFKHFIKNNNPNHIFSYCDFNKFDGHGYEAIGMKFIGYTGPDKTWIINSEAIKRNPKKYKEYKDKASSIVWGAGSKKYLYTNINYKEEQ